MNPLTTISLYRKSMIKRLIHSTLDFYRIYHFIHHIGNRSVLVYVSSYRHQDAILLLEKIPNVESVSHGVDVDSQFWIELHFSVL